MQDISDILTHEMSRGMSALRAFIVATDVHLQQPESEEKSGRRLRDTRNSTADRQVLGIHLRGDSDSRL